MNEKLNPLTEGDGERMAAMLRGYLDAEQVGARVAALRAAFKHLSAAYQRALARRARWLCAGAFCAAAIALAADSLWGCWALAQLGAYCLWKAEAHEDLADHSQEAE